MLALVAAACSESSAATRRLTVFAAASLEPAFDALATEFEERHPAVEAVTYPGLDSSPYKERAARIVPKGAGALFIFR